MSRPAVPTAGVTGATGYLGSVITARFRDAGWNTVALGRRQPASADDQWRRFDLADEPLPTVFDGLDVLVHCAYDLQAHNPHEVWQRNVEGTRRLLAAARGVPRTIVVSSMSAYDGTTQIYGQAKLIIEGYAAEAGAIVVRPGLVWGPGAGGMAGTLRRLSRLPLTPVVKGAGHQFTVHEDDLAGSVLTLATTDLPPGSPVGLACPEPVPFRQLLDTLAHQDGDGRCVRFVPVGWRVPLYALRLLERLPRGPAIRADSLLGLVKPAPFVPGQEAAERLGLSFRPLVPRVSRHDGAVSPRS